jgi:hypothetical protein
VQTEVFQSSNEGVWKGDGDTEKVWAGVWKLKKKNVASFFMV